jgi:hypothetical protein
VLQRSVEPARIGGHSGARPSRTRDAGDRGRVRRLNIPVNNISAALIFLSSPLCQFVTGEDWYIDGGEALNLAHDARDLIDVVKFANCECGDARLS